MVAVREGANIRRARQLRKALTKPELWLWLRLKDRKAIEIVFRNQHPIGPYVLDFYCPKAKLCIEVDGEIHTHDHQQQHDKARDLWLNNKGICIYRIKAIDLLNNPDETAQGVIDLARERIINTPPTAFGGSPSP
nr:endonuclease domain-containing protein [Asticcacaulis machinosus]